jgi:tetratricopeptide (TPR) repeat protein
VHVDPLGPRELKGLSRPVEVFQVTGRTGAESRLEARHWRRVRLVDREEEREQLSSNWTDAAGGAFQATLVVGEPGIGKSRVLECAREMATERGGAHVTLQCSPYHANSVLHPLARALEHQAAIASTDDSTTRWEKLSKLAEGVGQASAEEMQLLAALLSIPLPADAKEVDLSSEDRREQTFQLLLGWFERLARAAPLLVAVEDIQWADPSTLELLRRITDVRPARTFLVLTSRPEGEASLAGALPVLALRPLQERHRAEMVDDLTVGRAIPSHVRRLIIERSDGVPLFIEELANEPSVAASAPSDTRQQPEAEIPPLLQDLLTARLEAFPEFRHLAQVVAAVGQRVPLSLLEMLLEDVKPTTRAGAQSLVEGGILQLDTATPEPTYSFRHSLLRDAAYHGVLRSRRRHLHLRIAEVLEAHFPATAEAQPDVLAHHYEQAEERLRAAECWHRAGERAVALAAHTESVRYQRRALESLAGVPEGGRPVELELSVQTALGCSLLALQGYASPEAGAVYERALALSSEGDLQPDVATIYGLWAYYLVRGEHAVAHDLARRALAAAYSSGDRESVWEASTMLGYQLFFLGSLEEARALLEEGACYQPRETGSTSLTMPQDPGVACTVNLAPALWMLGYPEQADRLVRSALSRVETLPSSTGPFTRAYSHNFVAWYFQLLGDHSAAAAHAQRAIEISQTHNFANWLVAGHLHLAIATAASGSPDDAIPVLVGGLMLWRQGGAELFRSYFLAGLADAHRRAGDLDAALASVDEAIQHAERHRERFYEAELHRLRGELLLQRGPERRHEAAAELRQAVAVARQQRAKTLELRAMTSLYLLETEHGAAETTASQLAALLESFTEGLGAAEVVAARAALYGEGS